MAKTIKKSQLHESIRRYIKERLNREEEEMTKDIDAADEPMGDMPSKPESATEKFYSDIDSLEDTVKNDMGGNQDLLASIEKLEQQAKNLGYPRSGGELEGGKEIGM